MFFGLKLNFSFNLRLVHKYFKIKNNFYLLLKYFLLICKPDLNLNCVLEHNCVFNFQDANLRIILSDFKILCRSLLFINQTNYSLSGLKITVWVSKLLRSARRIEGCQRATRYNFVFVNRIVFM